MRSVARGRTKTHASRNRKFAANATEGSYMASAQPHATAWIYKILYVARSGFITRGLASIRRAA